MGLHGPQRASMDLPGPPWASKGLHGPQRASKVPHGPSRGSRSLRSPMESAVSPLDFWLIFGSLKSPVSLAQQLLRASTINEWPFFPKFSRESSFAIQNPLFLVI